MKVALTADNHLTTSQEHPERYHALAAILRDVQAQGIGRLIIAGDLFDASRQNYADFEALCRRRPQIEFTIIPGNHDPAIDNKTIVADNVRIITSPQAQIIDGRSFFFQPYQAGITMGENLPRFADQLPPGDWVLVGHGDWADGLSRPNPVEPGVYMPLTRRDVEATRPARVFLGHIHRAMDRPPVHYVGSPCGLDITETGRRRYLVYDTASNQVEPRPVDTDVLYFNESFVILPVADEAAYLRDQITARKQAWGLRPEEKQKAQLRIRVRGYSADRGALRNLLQAEFEGFAFYKGEEPDISEVSSSTDVERDYLAQATLARLAALDWPFGADEPERDAAVLAALNLIYGG